MRSTRWRKSYRFRILVECAPLREPGFRPEPGEAARLRAMHAAPFAHAQGWFEANRAFHEALAAWSGNRFILDAVSRQNALRRLTELGTYRALGPSRVARSTAEHLGILDAIEAGDLLAAKRQLTTHLRAAAQYMGVS